jgi:hypothetical protein
MVESAQVRGMECRADSRTPQPNSVDAMIAPIRSMPLQYELYRVILDYQALQDGFLDRIEDLNTSLQQIDLAGGFAHGNVQKLLCKSPAHLFGDHRANNKRTFEWESLGKMLKGTGLALVLVLDDERFAPLKERLMERKRPRQPAMAGSKRPAWLFTKKKAREFGKKRFSLMTESERTRHQRKAGKASAKARRKAGALLTSPASSPSGYGQSSPHTRTNRRP